MIWLSCCVLAVFACVCVLWLGCISKVVVQCLFLKMMVLWFLFLALVHVCKGRCSLCVDVEAERSAQRVAEREARRVAGFFLLESRAPVPAENVNAVRRNQSEATCAATGKSLTGVRLRAVYV